MNLSRIDEVEDLLEEIVEDIPHDIKVIQGDSSLFIAMPSRKLSNGEFRDIAHPINQEARNAIEKIIFEKYEELPDEEEAEVAEGTEE